MEKEFNNIIEQIKSNLTEDKNKNLKYLKAESDKYKDHPMGHEIIKEIGRLIFKNLDNESVENLINAIDKDCTSHLDNGLKYMQEKNFIKAKQELESFVSISKTMFQNDKIYNYYTPRNPIEFILLVKDNSEKKIKDLGIDFSKGYCLLGFIDIENKEYDKARENLLNALRWNPYNTEAIFEYAESFKMSGNINQYKKETLNAYNKIYNPNDLARYYRNLGFYNIEMQNWELAKALYLYSIRLENHPNAEHELIYILQKSNDKTLYKPEESKIILMQNNIPTKVDINIFNTLKELYESMIRHGDEKSNLGIYVDSLIDFWIKL